MNNDNPNNPNPNPKTYLVTSEGTGLDRVSYLVIPAEGETPPGRPAASYPRMPPSPKG